MEDISGGPRPYADLEARNDLVRHPRGRPNQQLCPGGRRRESSRRPSRRKLASAGREVHPQARLAGRPARAAHGSDLLRAETKRTLSLARKEKRAACDGKWPKSREETPK